MSRTIFSQPLLTYVCGISGGVQAIEVAKDRFINWTGDFVSIDTTQEFASVGGIPTTSVTSDGQITKMRIEHIWVEAAIDDQPSRGAG